MKRSEHSTQDWADDFAQRMRLEQTPTMPSTRPPASGKLPVKRESTPRAVTRLGPPASATTALTRLRDLSPSAVLVLFTPVMVPSGFSDPSQTVTKTSQGRAKLDVDPFEMLGRALSKQHNRIRHVPYIPSVGFTETHYIFVSKADALVILACEPDDISPPSKDNTSTPSSEQYSTLQGAFAMKAAGVLQEEGRLDRVPMVCVHFGDDQFPFEMSTYKDVWAGERYTAESVEQIVQLLFGSRKPSAVDKKAG